MKRPRYCRLAIAFGLISLCGTVALTAACRPGYGREYEPKVPVMKRLFTLKSMGIPEEKRLDFRAECSPDGRYVCLYSWYTDPARRIVVDMTGRPVPEALAPDGHLTDEFSRFFYYAVPRTSEGMLWSGTEHLGSTQLSRLADSAPLALRPFLVKGGEWCVSKDMTVGFRVYPLDPPGTWKPIGYSGELRGRRFVAEKCRLLPTFEVLWRQEFPPSFDEPMGTAQIATGDSVSFYIFWKTSHASILSDGDGRALKTFSYGITADEEEVAQRRDEMNVTLERCAVDREGKWVAAGGPASPLIHVVSTRQPFGVLSKLNFHDLKWFAGIGESNVMHLSSVPPYLIAEYSYIYKSFPLAKERYPSEVIDVRTGAVVWSENTLSIRYPTVSPDGRWLGYMRDGELWVGSFDEVVSSKQPVR